MKASVENNWYEIKSRNWVIFNKKKIGLREQTIKM